LDAAFVNKNVPSKKKKSPTPLNLEYTLLTKQQQLAKPALTLLASFLALTAHFQNLFKQASYL
jgi:hypothetical protein